ncbi:exonuclease RNase T and DNA polymerase III [Thioploca ingrica]|uniref:Exonuclease RNase T and DNA polymerase III n=1 Tax=Thioploca ingrica TaxID=40754 RepID=A0A090APC4_9GAMM|nr:exonuclease RNase T and DNA polymerase III [Thioploca ingrica]
MFSNLYRRFNQRRLKDPNYAFLFEPSPMNEVVCIDCETDSLNPKKAQLLSLGAVRIQGNRVLISQKLELFVKPATRIDAASIKVHGLRHCDVANGLEPEEAVLIFLDFIGSRQLVGYYLEFDIAIINKYLKPILGITLPNAQLEVSGLYYQDKLKRLRQDMALPHIDLRFDTIMYDLGLPIQGKHNAFNDALMTALMYVKLKNISSSRSHATPHCH